MLSCDWGTSTFRLKLVERATGDVVASLESASGTKKISDAWADKGDTGERISFYLEHLENEIRWLADKTGEEMDGIPVVISGMASSSIGITELPYAPLPLSLDQPELELQRFEETEAFPHQMLMISGIYTDRDLMRGEETQILGLSKRRDIRNSVCVLPGTHSKHVRIVENRITRFKTFLTGELFALLSEESILKHSVTKPVSDFNEAAFQRGIDASGADNILHHLFTIRAGDILHGTPKEEQHDFLSGLLIGTELRELKQGDAGPGHGSGLFLVGESGVHSYYAGALQFLNIPFTLVADADELVAAGHRFILEYLEPHQN